ncbi:thioredoxin-disulfide reductase [Neobittarella massiliensis]|uniref:Thioredoxin reductase n=1 Tax=Neobittarella massiliensis (ex Bilen et al. 2018) TaxID=2041842 RepID=A0A8J6IHG5_9FIRM|nr:thioredoxin-disulfide reductase [Neobittarella massiliensis]MBC3517175.1 thioredoxin-disulfide reductase [Neobittarella massiliensis]
MERQPQEVDILIIGAGTAGLTAAMYGARGGNSVIVLESNVHGGQIINTWEVENYPSIAKISGVELATNMYEQAVSHGAEVRYEQIEGHDFSGPIKTVYTAQTEYRAKAVILANGVISRKLDIPGEQKYTGHGVSYCATCDGNFYKNKVTAVIGGGNTALEDALFLSNQCQKVYILHRRDTFRGEQHNVNAVKKRANIEILYNTIPLEIQGQDKVSALRCQNVVTQEQQTLVVDGVFVAVGRIPQNTPFADSIQLDESGFVLAGEDTKTSVPGVFAAGDTRQKQVRQLVTAAADGAVAAVMAGSYIAAELA